MEDKSNYLLFYKKFDFLIVMFMTAYSAQVFEGHPFIVEAGVSLGGKDVKQVCLSAVMLA